MRRKTRKIFYGGVGVGGDSPISIQSMSTFPASMVKEVTGQIEELAAAGCEIVRVSVKDRSDAEAFREICGESPIPVIADVHFDYRLAVSAAAAGAAGLRINPGNIGGEEKVMAVIDAAGEAGIPVRIGVNSGSLEKDLRQLFSSEPARALSESALRSLGMIERTGFKELVFSLKSSDPLVTVESNRLFSATNGYPLHIGVTEAGPVISGTARSVVALTIMLSEGIGDTVRISLSGNPVLEVTAASAMLSALGLRPDIPVIISCPTCGRCNLDVAGIAEKLEKILPGRGRYLKVAVMGCEVNGPGEAAEADIGLAGTRNGAALFRKGKIEGRIEGDLLGQLISGIDVLAEEKRDPGEKE